MSDSQQLINRRIAGFVLPIAVQNLLASLVSVSDALMLGMLDLLMALPQVFLCMMKNSGRIIRSTLYGGIAVIINIVLNGIFIFGLFGLPAMGASGAAAATVIAIGAELLLVLAENITVDCVRIRRQYVKTGNIRLLKEFAQYSLPVLADLLVWGLGFTVFSIIISHMGNDAVAANSIANTAKNIISCFCLGLGGGTEIIIGNELGKNNLETAKWYGNRLLRLAAWTGIISGAVLVLSTPLYLGLSASLSSRALEYLKWMLLICGFYMVGKSINVTLIDGVFCAGGDTRFGLWCDTVIMWLIIAPLGALAAFVIKLPVPLVYLILSLDECLKAPAAYMHYRKYQWVKNLT